MVLFDGGGDHAGYADAVAAHDQVDRLALFAQDVQLHRFAVLGAKLEDMTDLDAALDHQGALAVRAGVAFDDIAQVGDLGQRQVALPVHAEVVLVLDVGASGEIAHQGDGAVDDAGDRQVDRAQRAGAGADGGTDLGLEANTSGLATSGWLAALISLSS